MKIYFINSWFTYTFKNKYKFHNVFDQIFSENTWIFHNTCKCIKLTYDVLHQSTV